MKNKNPQEKWEKDLLKLKISGWTSDNGIPVEVWNFIEKLFKLEKDQLLERIKLEKITTFTKEEEEQMRGFEPTSQQQHRIDIDFFSQGYNQAIVDLEKIKEEIKEK